MLAVVLARHIPIRICHIDTMNTKHISFMYNIQMIRWSCKFHLTDIWFKKILASFGIRTQSFLIQIFLSRHCLFNSDLCHSEQSLCLYWISSRPIYSHCFRHQQSNSEPVHLMEWLSTCSTNKFPKWRSAHYRKGFCLDHFAALTFHVLGSFWVL